MFFKNMLPSLVPYVSLCLRSNVLQMSQRDSFYSSVALCIFEVGASKVTISQRNIVIKISFFFVYFGYKLMS
jgi:hypothetical protein